MTSTRVVYYVDTPDGEASVGSSDVFADILAKLALTVTRSEGDDETKMEGLARFAKLYKLRYTGHGYIEEFFYATIDGNSIHISYVSEKPGAIKIFERIKDTLGNNIKMVYSMISIDNNTNVLIAVNTDKNGYFFNERVAALVTVNHDINKTDGELFNVLVSKLCTVYQGRDFDDLAHQIFRDHSVLPLLPEQLTHVFNVIADCEVAALGKDMLEWKGKFVDVVCIEFLPEFPLT